MEELIRAAAEGKGEGGPDTVLAMLQARLSRLPPRSRTLLCAASIFGTSFWPGGVAALLARGDTEALAACYPYLLEQELIEAQAGSRLAGEEEFRFRHDLVRDAAYGLLSDEDRALGHELAARYLAAAGELDAFPIAEHFRLGGVRAEAALWYQRAAEQALAANELELCR
ncbi:MAG TPA: serine/threonine-protein kinase PknK, partial [Pseudomonadota bacterium]|nr:serine/threonine-protein kinase PknK [Pseudomonadota bacterium]